MMHHTPQSGFISSSQRASRACPEDERDILTVSLEGDTYASKNAWFRPCHTPSVCLMMRRADGFTLVEFLLYIALSVGLVVMLGNIGVDMLVARERVNALEEIRYSMPFVFERIRRHVAEADTIDTPVRGESGDTLTLRVSDPTRDPTVFFLREGSVYMQEGEHDEVRLSTTGTEVTSLTFTNLSIVDAPDVIKIEGVADAYGGDGRGGLTVEHAFYSTAQIRK